MHISAEKVTCLPPKFVPSRYNLADAFSELGQYIKLGQFVLTCNSGCRYSKGDKQQGAGQNYGGDHSCCCFIFPRNTACCVCNQNPETAKKPCIWATERSRNTRRS